MPVEEPMEDSVRKRYILEFGNYVKRRMLKFRDQSLAIKEFKLYIYGFVLSYMSKDVDIWLKLHYKKKRVLRPLKLTIATVRRVANVHLRMFPNRR
jgi:hypothetical protein